MLVALTVATSLLAVAATLIKRQNTDIAATNTAEQLHALGDAALLQVSVTQVIHRLIDMSLAGEASEIIKYLPPNLVSLKTSPFDGPYYVLAGNKEQSGAVFLACTRVPSQAVASKIASLLSINGLYVSYRRDGTPAFSGVAGTLSNASPFSKEYLDGVIGVAKLPASGTPESGGDKSSVLPSAVCYATSTTQTEFRGKDKDVWLHRTSELGHEDWNRMSADIDMNGRKLSNVQQMSINDSGATLGTCKSKDSQNDEVCLSAASDRRFLVGQLDLRQNGSIRFANAFGVGASCQLGQMAVSEEGRLLLCKRTDDNQSYRFAQAEGFSPAWPKIQVGKEGRRGIIPFDEANLMERKILDLGNGDGENHVKPHVPPDQRVWSYPFDVPREGAARELMALVDIRSYENANWPSDNSSIAGGKNSSSAASWAGTGNAAMIWAISEHNEVLDYEHCHFLAGMGTCRLRIKVLPGMKGVIRMAWGGISFGGTTPENSWWLRSIMVQANVIVDSPFRKIDQ